MNIAEYLLEDLGVEFINSRLSFFNGALWKGGDEGKSFSEWITVRSHKLDNS